jgi:hypothetical protein
VDFFTVPTLTFGVLYCFFVIAHDWRRILHCNVTKHPTSAWAIHQLRDQHISGHHKPIAATDRLKLTPEEAASRTLAQRRQPSITTESDEMKIPGFQTANKALGHDGAILYRWQPGRFSAPFDEGIVDIQRLGLMLAAEGFVSTRI